MLFLPPDAISQMRFAHRLGALHRVAVALCRDYVSDTKPVSGSQLLVAQLLLALPILDCYPACLPLTKCQFVAKAFPYRSMTLRESACAWLLTLVIFASLASAIFQQPMLDV